MSTTDFLSWDGFTLAPPAFLCANPHALYATTLRGSDRMVPGSVGVITSPRRLAPVEVVLELTIFGDTSPAGVPYADPYLGVQSNLAALIAACAPVSTGNGTRSVTWTRRGALPDLVAPCIVGPVIPGADLGWSMTATLDLVIPYTNGVGWSAP